MMLYYLNWNHKSISGTVYIYIYKPNLVGMYMYLKYNSNNNYLIALRSLIKMTTTSRDKPHEESVDLITYRL